MRAPHALGYHIIKVPSPEPDTDSERKALFQNELELKREQKNIEFFTVQEKLFKDKLKIVKK